MEQDDSGSVSRVGRRRGKISRCLPALSALLLLGTLIGACGRSIFPKVGDSSGPGPAPGSGIFLFVTNSQAATVSGFTRSQSTGALTANGSAKAGSASGSPSLAGIAEGLSGNQLYVVNSSAGEVHQYTIGNGGKLTSLGGGVVPVGNNPQWITISNVAGGVFAYVTNAGDGSISQFIVNSDGTLADNGSLPAGTLVSPFGAVATGAYLYVADNGSGTMNSFPINADGTLGAGTSIPSSSSGTRSPDLVIIDPSGSFVYVSDNSASANVSLFTTSGGALTFVQTYPVGVGGVVGMAIAAPSGGNHFLYAVNQPGNSITVFQMNASTGALTNPTVAFTSLSTPTGVAADPTGSFLYVANSGDNTVTKFTIDAASGALSGPVSVSTGSVPQFIAIAP